MSKEMFFMLADSSNERQLKDLQWRIKGRLKAMIVDAESMIKYIDNQEAAGLGGSLQSTWDLYLMIGEYQEALMTRKMFNEIKNLPE